MTATRRAAKRCCDADCWAEHDQERLGACWGDVDVIDEDYPDDPDLATWVHGCEGHANGYGGPYIPEPKATAASPPPPR